MYYDCRFIQPFTSHTTQVRNILLQMPPEKLREVVGVDVRLDQCSQVPNSTVVVARAPEEGGMHQCSHDTDSWRREASLVSGKASS